MYAAQTRATARHGRTGRQASIALYAWNARPAPAAMPGGCTMEIPTGGMNSYRVGLWIFGRHETDTRIISDFEP